MENKLRNEYFGCIIYIPNLKSYVYGDFLTKELILNYDKVKSIDYIKYLINKYHTNINEINDIKNYIKSLGINNRNIDIVNNSYPESRLVAPLRVFLDFTYKCNLKCKHCFTESGLKRNDELTLEQKKNIIDQMISMGSYRISLAGGEPLISDEFFLFVEYAREKGVDVSFTTNGTLINNNIIEKLNKLKIKTLTISLEGPDRETNDYIRGKGSFDTVINNIKLLRKNYNGTIALRMTLMKCNIDKMEEYVKLAEEYGCKKVKFNCIRPTGRASKNKELLLNSEEYIDAIKLGNKLNKTSKIDVVLPLNPYDGCSYSYIESLGFGCVAGKDCMTICPDGQVKPCSQMSEEYVAGNCKTTDLKTIWDDGNSFKYFRNLEGNVTCKNCNIYDKCRGGCRYRALIDGDINKIDPFCYLKKGGCINEK